MNRLPRPHRFPRRVLFLLMACGLLLGTAAVQAQPVADLEAVTVLDDATNQLEVTVRMTAQPAEGLGVSTIVFFFNDGAIALPSRPSGVVLVEGTDYAYQNGFGDDCYDNSTVTRPQTGEVSVNIDYSYAEVFGFCGVDGGTVIPEAGIDLVTVFFDILDPSQTAQLLFNPDPGVTALFADDDAFEPTQFVNGTFTGNDTVLPVELVAFEALVRNRAVELTWETASETNNAGFEVQHRTSVETNDPVASTNRSSSVDTTWATLDFVEGMGTTAEPQTYRHEVPGLAPGAHRFRLKQVDFDGTFAYSPEVEVTVAVPGNYHLSPLYPNPFNPRAQFSLSVARTQHLEVAAFDVTGRQVKTLFEGTLEGQRARVISFEAGDLPSGLYLLRVHGEYFVATHKATLLK